MIPYWLAFIFPMLLSLRGVSRRYVDATWIIVLVSFVIFAGLRYEVGGDWGSYFLLYDDARHYSFWEYLSRSDPGYMLLNWLSSRLGGGVYLVNTLSALIFFSCLIIFCRAQPLPFLAFAIAIPYMGIVVSMGYSRQVIALSFVMLGYKYLSEGKLRHYLLYIFVAALFHKSAVILLPLGIFYLQRRLALRLIGVGGFSVIMVYLFILDHVDLLWVNYVDAQMQSDGGLVRLLMNVAPSILLFMYFRKIKQTWPDYRMWMVLALGTMCLLPFIGFASTAVDRVALYLIPLQLVVFSRLPMLFTVTGGRVMLSRIIVSYYALVLYVWLNYASHALYWLPYQNVITLDIF